MKLRELIDFLESTNENCFNVYGNDYFLFNSNMFYQNIVSDGLLDGEVESCSMSHGIWEINVDDRS